MFVTEQGLAVNGSWLTKHFQAALAHAGLPRDAGCMICATERQVCWWMPGPIRASPRNSLRHAPGSRVTMELYAHVTAAQERNAADLLDSVVNPRSRQSR